MNNYEFTDPLTGEIRSLQTNIDIGLIQEYNDWVVDGKLNPPEYSPVEFAEYRERVKRLEALDRAIAILEDMGIEQVDKKTILRVLRNEE